jgi:hypothetical protein
MNVQSELLHWVKEREKVRLAKEASLPKPWTTDTSLRDYKFCNVNREHDRVTLWVFDNWLRPFADHPNIAFAMCVARHFNWPDTLEAITDLVFADTWEPEKVRVALKERRDTQGKKIYTGAYMISTNGVSMDKIDYSIDRVLTPLRTTLRNPNVLDGIQSYVTYLQTFNGFSSFMAGQVVADLKHIEPLIQAKDWNTWTPLGPGSIRGLNRFFGRPLSAIIKPAQGIKELREIQSIIKSELNMDVALHNVQNVMCETDKYLRIKYDGGKVRSKYNGRA